MVKLPEDSGFPAFVAQRIEHLTTDQKVGGSSPSKRTNLNIQLSVIDNCLAFISSDIPSFKVVCSLECIQPVNRFFA